VARLHHDDHENGLIDDTPGTGENGAIAPGTMALFALGFVLGAVAIGSMGIAIKPVDPPAVRPIELRSPDERDRNRAGADGRRDRGEPRRGSERRERRRPSKPAAPVPPQARQQPSAQAAPPAASQPRSPAPRPNPAPAPRPQPAPAAPAPPAPAPPAPAPPPGDDDGGDDDAGGDADAGGTGELDDDAD
jgi:hypothetical protein